MFQLMLWNRRHQLGYVFESSAGLTLPDGSVRSPSDGLAPLRRKMETYLANGVQVGFLLDPSTETDILYRPGKEPKEVSSFDQSISAEPAFTGFMLDLRPLRRLA